MMSEELTSQSEAALVIRRFGGVAVVTGLTPTAAPTLVLAVVADARVYHVTSNRPELLGVRSAGRKDSPPLCGWSSRTGLAWTGLSEFLSKLCRRMSPKGWNRASFQTMLTVPNLPLTASRGKSLAGNRL